MKKWYVKTITVNVNNIFTRIKLLNFLKDSGIPFCNNSTLFNWEYIVHIENRNLVENYLNYLIKD